MHRIFLLTLLTTFLCVPAMNTNVFGWDRMARMAAVRPWHLPYYHPQARRPVSLVVPPNTAQTIYSWGVAGTQMRPIYHQYHRGPQNTIAERGHLRAPPGYPASTQQMGIHYIRAPW
jgi:hypothetical protein